MWCLLLVTLAALRPAETRRVAITIDDLPFVSLRALPDEEIRARTGKLLGHLRERDVPAVGFVNEGKIFEGAGEDPEKVGLLALWLEAGMELGNHTYSHLDLHRASLVESQQDVLRGEVVTRRLLAERGRVPRYFRHPFLHTGTDPRARAAFESFLAERGYRVAPVTLDNYDYLFARAYDAAGEGEKGRVLEAYLLYMAAVVEYYEAQSRAIVGYEPPQILLLHANTLNADGLGRLFDILVGRGYRFVSLEEALQDAAFSLPDDYTGPGGITWLHRWALTRGLPKSTFAGEPKPSGFLPELR
jgi:peptidoglycan/xylan/chitin deacetylase (PgdA/CDA1 family)